MLYTLLIIQLDLPPHPRCICTPFVDIPFDLSNLLHPCIIITTLSLSCIHNVLFPFVLWTLIAHIVICIASFSCEIQCKSSFLLWRRNPSYKMMATHASSICFSWRLAFMFLAVAFSGVALPPPELGLLKIDGTQRLFRIQYIPYHANCSIRISGRNMDRTGWRAFLICFSFRAYLHVF